MSRSHKGRKDFKVNNILARVVANKKKEAAPMADFMTITFLGVYDKKGLQYSKLIIYKIKLILHSRILLSSCEFSIAVSGELEPVKLETILHKICHKKRKDVTSPSLQVVLGTSDVPVNPSEEHPPTQAPTVSIPTESFTRSNSHMIKSFNLMLKATNMPQLPMEMDNGGK
jgi:polycomb protein SUZ12